MDWLLCWIEGHQGLASWVQGVASVAAIWWAGHLSRKQAAHDRATAMAVVHETKRQADLQLAQAVSVLSRSAWHWLDHIRTETFADRQAVHDVAAGAKHYDSTAVERLEEALKAVPLHSLVSPEWVVNVLSAIATLERARRHIDKAVELHRQMDAETFNRFFTSLDRMSKALEDITTQLNNGVIALKG